MCRSIKVLRVAEEPATRDEISAAALQFVRKVSGFRKPSRANEQVFNQAIAEISNSVEHLLGELSVPSARVRRGQASNEGNTGAPDQPQPIMEILAPRKADRRVKEHAAHQDPQHVNRP
jgi:hypothetical protein